jgi:hypothetical protein
MEFCRNHTEIKVGFECLRVCVNSAFENRLIWYVQPMSLLNLAALLTMQIGEQMWSAWLVVAGS